MLKELVLIGIVIAAGIGVSRLWVSQHKGWSAVLCVAVVLLVTWLARRWQIDLGHVG